MAGVCLVDIFDNANATVTSRGPVTSRGRVSYILPDLPCVTVLSNSVPIFDNANATATS